MAGCLLKRFFGNTNSDKVIMADIMSYSYQAEWPESQTESMREWLASTWKTLDGNEPEQDFVEYIMVRCRTPILGPQMGNSHRINVYRL
jgi:hypothetical protein